MTLDTERFLTESRRCAEWLAAWPAYLDGGDETLGDEFLQGIRVHAPGLSRFFWKSTNAICADEAPDRIAEYTFADGEEPITVATAHGVAGELMERLAEEIEWAMEEHPGDENAVREWLRTHRTLDGRELCRLLARMDRERAMFEAAEQKRTEHIEAENARIFGDLMREIRSRPRKPDAVAVDDVELPETDGPTDNGTPAHTANHGVIEKSRSHLPGLWDEVGYHFTDANRM
jgi:hypothetical protein